MSGSASAAAPTGLPGSDGSSAWKTAYAAMYRDGAAAFPPACLYYVLEKVRQAGTALTPADTIRVFRAATRADFGPLAGEVLDDWGLRTPKDLGQAVDLLGRYGCLTLDSGDTPGNFAQDEVPFGEIDA